MYFQQDHQKVHCHPPSFVACKNYVFQYWTMTSLPVCKQNQKQIIIWTGPLLHVALWVNRYLRRITFFGELCIFVCGGMLASWLVCSFPDREVQFWALFRDFVLCPRARHFTLTVPLSTQVYKWVLANLMLGVTPGWTSIPSRGD